MSHHDEHSIIPVLLGPTASGKTSVGIELAKILNGEIISVDSRKVYKGLKIGTAVPEGRWENGALVVEGIPHHLIGHLDPDAVYTAGDFAKDAERLIEEIFARGKLPILVGGTGFYFKALQKGLPQLPKRDEELRAQFSRRIDVEGLAALHRELSSVDTTAANNIAANDPHKIIRALEVYYLTGKPFSIWKNVDHVVSKYSFAVLGLTYSKTFLEQRIEERSRQMYVDGMIDEARELLKQGYKKTCPALASFGYREAVEVIEGQIKESEFLPKLIQGTKSYAKRQRTWFRTQVAPYWFECTPISDKREIALKMKDFLGSELIYSPR